MSIRGERVLLGAVLTNSEWNTHPDVSTENNNFRKKKECVGRNYRLKDSQYDRVNIIISVTCQLAQPLE